MQDYKLTGRVWLTRDEETVLGDGKISLLQLIAAMGSLRKAALDMKMSYRKAWYSIQQINKTACEPVVVLTRGGKEGGHAALTAYGVALLENHLKQQAAFQAFLDLQNNL